MSVSTVDRARMVRRRAKSLGLRMVQRGNIYELRDGDGILLSGSIAAAENYVAERFIARSPGPATARIPETWTPMISEYCLSLAAAGQTAPTIRLQRRKLA